MEIAAPRAPANPTLVPSMPLVAHVAGYTAAPHFHRAFVELTAEQALSRLDDFVAGAVVLNAHMPPFGAGEYPQGQLTLEVSSPTGEACCLGIAFAHASEGKPFRSGFDFAAFARYPEDPQSSGIVTASFDECWLLLCKLLEGLKPSSVHFSFGA